MNFKKMTILAILVIAVYLFNLPVLVQAGGEGWHTDLAKVKEIAKKENKHILVDFSGSDWCGWCIKLDKEVFSKDEFKEYAKKNLVLYMADFPKANKPPAEVEKENRRLMKKFGARGFPTVIIMDADENEIAKTGYQAGGAVNYVNHLKGIIPAVKSETKEEKSEEINQENEHGWLEDFSKAKELAKKENKKILIDFSGSDWCGWCIKLEDEVFSKEEFKTYAKENLILYLADFPSAKAQSEELKKENKRLAAKFGVRGYPTILVIDADELEVGRSGYKAGGPVEYVKHLQTIVK